MSALATSIGVSKASVAGVVAVVVVLVVLIAAILIAVGLRRRRESELHSVQGYRRRLQTLGQLQERSSSSVRLLGQDRPGHPAGVAGRDEPDRPGERWPDASPVGAGARRPPLAGGDRPGRAPGGRRPPMLEDDRLPPVPVPPSWDVPRRRVSQLSSRNHWPRQLAGPVAVIVAGVVIVGIIAAFAGSGKPGARAGSGTGGNGSATSSGGGHADGSSGKKTQPTSTTLPSSYSPTTATATAATYVPPVSPYTLVVGATTGNCWISVTSGGSTVLAQTFSPGTEQSLSLSGVATVLVGAPSVLTVTLDGAPVVLPSGFGSPFTMTLSPAR